MLSKENDIFVDESYNITCICFRGNSRDGGPVG